MRFGHDLVAQVCPEGCRKLINDHNQPVVLGAVATEMTRGEPKPQNDWVEQDAGVQVGSAMQALNPKYVL